MTKIKRVAIVGMAPSTRGLAPFDDPDIEIWTLNESAATKFDFIKRVDRLFQLHPRWSFMRETNHNDPEHPEMLQSIPAPEDGGYPIMMQEAHDDIPASTYYPLAEICEHFGIESDTTKPDHFRYFTSTFPYMIALAMYEGYTHIEVYGFEMGSNTEFAQQRGSALWWLGWAKGTGIEIILPDGAGLIGWHDKLYGYEQIPEIGRMHLEIYMAQFGRLSDKHEAEANYHSGQLEASIKEINGNPQIGKGKKDKLIAAAQGMEHNKINSLLQAAHGRGAKEILQFLLAQLDGQRLPDIAGFNAEINKDPYGNS